MGPTDYHPKERIQKTAGEGGDHSLMKSYLLNREQIMKTIASI